MVRAYTQIYIYTVIIILYTCIRHMVRSIQTCSKVAQWLIITIYEHVWLDRSWLNVVTKIMFLILIRWHNIIVYNKAYIHMYLFCVMHVHLVTLSAIRDVSTFLVLTTCTSFRTTLFFKHTLVYDWVIYEIIIWIDLLSKEFKLLNSSRSFIVNNSRHLPGL